MQLVVVAKILQEVRNGNLAPPTSSITKNQILILK